MSGKCHNSGMVQHQEIWDYSTFFFPYNQRLQRCFESFVEVDGVHFDLDLNMALPTKIQHITEFTRWNLAAKFLLS